MKKILLSTLLLFNCIDPQATLDQCEKDALKLCKGAVDDAVQSALAAAGCTQPDGGGSWSCSSSWLCK